MVLSINLSAKRNKFLQAAIAAGMAFGMTSTALADDAHASHKTVPQGQVCAIQDDKACQDALTPDQVLAHLKAGNKRFAAGRPRAKNYVKQVKATSSGQYPLASVVSCIDSRAPAEIVFDAGIGDMFNARVAGNIVNEDILGSLEYASKVAGSKLIVVLGHTQCGAIKGTCDGVEMGNLTGLIAKIKPAMSKVADDGTPRNSKNAKFVQAVAEMNVADTVKTIREKSPILAEMEKAGKIKIVGAMYDVSTGRVAFYD